MHFSAQTHARPRQLRARQLNHAHKSRISANQITSYYFSELSWLVSLRVPHETGYPNECATTVADRQPPLSPHDAGVLKVSAPGFPVLKTFNVEGLFGSWAAVQTIDFADGGAYDQIVLKR